MRRCQWVLGLAGAAALLAPAVASASVQFDDLYVATDATVTYVNGMTNVDRQDDPSKDFTSLSVVKGGVSRAASESTTKAGGYADAGAGASAMLLSKKEGAFAFDLSSDSGTSKAGATADGLANADVDYRFTLTGSKLYDLSAAGFAGGSTSGAGAAPGFITALYDDTTGLFVWQTTTTVGSSFSHVISDLANGTYEFYTINLGDVDSPSSGVGGASIADMTGETFFQISSVPEPETWALTIFGLFGLGAMMRGQRKARTTTLAA